MGSAEGGVKTLLRLEGLAIVAAALAGYIHVGGDWKLFAILILAPDLAFLGYLFGPRVGAAGYNTLHSSIGPLALGGVALAMHAALPLAVALIWIAHIGFDRAIGFGLKYASSFNDTHISRTKIV